MLKFVFDRRGEPQEPSWQAAADYNPDFAAIAHQWSALPDGRLLRLPKTWQTMWNWLGGRGVERLGGPAVAGIAIPRFSIGSRARGP